MGKGVPREGTCVCEGQKVAPGLVPWTWGQQRRIWVAGAWHERGKVWNGAGAGPHHPPTAQPVSSASRCQALPFPIQKGVPFYPLVYLVLREAK